MRDGFSKPNVDGNGSNNTAFQKPLPLKDSHNLLRLLPAPKGFLKPGSWFDRQVQHFGYEVKNPKDETKPIPRTFACIEQKKWNDGKQAFVVTKHCPECDKNAQAKQALETLKVQYKDADTDTKREALKPLLSWTKKHNQDIKTVVYAMNDKREVGYARLPIGAFKKIKLLVKELSAQGVDPFDVDGGVWFDITRTGEDIMTRYDAAVVYDTVEVNGRRLKQERSAKMSEEEIEKAVNGQVDISKLLTVLPDEAVTRLVNSQSPEEVAAIFGVTTKVQAKDVDEDSEDDPQDMALPDPKSLTEQPKQPVPPNNSGGVMSDAQIRSLFNL